MVGSLFYQLTENLVKITKKTVMLMPARFNRNKKI